MIYALTSWPHYHDHLAPIIDALPDGVFGGTYTGKTPVAKLPREGLWLVAGQIDVAKLPGRRLVYVEHGAGQTYNVPSSSYAGSLGKTGVVLFICPRQEVADLWTATYPDAQTVVAGCPKMDEWHRGSGRKTGTRVTVGVTFHHDALVCPEANSAWPHYRKHLHGAVVELTEAGIDVVAHAHPRSRFTARRVWDGTGARWTDSLADIFDQADLLVADNTSALPEFASTGRPVVWLNAPWYRRHVEHGGRFWDWPAGQIQVDDPDDLVPGILAGLGDPPQVADARARMVRTIYEHTDGHASERAATAIMEVL